MSYVIFEKKTTRYLRIFRNRYWQDADFYKTEGAAKAGLRRAAEKSLKRAARTGYTADAINVVDYDIAEKGYFQKYLEKTEKKRHLLSGAEFEQSVNTPACCDPSTETYHSM